MNENVQSAIQDADLLLNKLKSLYNLAPKAKNQDSFQLAMDLAVESQAKIIGMLKVVDHSLND